MPREFEFPFPGSLISTFLVGGLGRLVLKMEHAWVNEHYPAHFTRSPPRLPGTGTTLCPYATAYRRALRTTRTRPEWEKWDKAHYPEELHPAQLTHLVVPT